MKNEIKIKGSFDKIKQKHILTVFFSSFAICLILRFFQVTKLIDHSTGFFIKDSFITVLFYLVLFVSSTMMLIMSFLSSDNRKLDDGALKKNKPLAIISLVLCVSMFIDFCYQGLTSLTAKSASQVNNIFPLTAVNSFTAKFQTIFALLSLIYYAIIAVRLFKGKKIVGNYKLLCIVPVGWAMVKLISLFATQISFIRVSDLFLEIVTDCFAIVFLLSYAQCISGVYENAARWRVTGAGLAFSLVALCTQIPRLVFTIFRKSNFVNSEYIIDYAVLMLGVFAVTLIFTVFKRTKYKDNLAEEFIIKVPEEDDDNDPFGLPNSILR